MATVALLMGLSTSLWAQVGDGATKEPDARVKKALETLGLKFDVTPRGNFKLVFRLSNDRTQVVFIQSLTYDYNGIEVREIYSPAQSFDKESDIPSEKLFSLLRDNADKKMGAWQIDGTGPYTLNFALRASVNSKPEILRTMLQLLAKVADGMEEKLSTKDDN